MLNMFKLLIDTLAPDTCVLCHQPQTPRKTHLLCDYCWAALPRNVQACRHCALPLPPSPAASQAIEGTCGRCLQQPLFKSFCLTALRHEGDAKLLVHQIKQPQGLRPGCTLAYALLAAVNFAYKNRPLPECIVPMPLSWLRQSLRGYNQAHWLAAPLAKNLRRPLLTNLVERRQGPAQHTLSRRERLRSQHNRFVSKKNTHFKHAAVVDDVLTTGGSVHALSHALRESGIETVDVWCATRATHG